MVMDLFSRQIVGWVVADRMRTSLCASALQISPLAKEQGVDYSITRLYLKYECIFWRKTA